MAAGICNQRKAGAVCCGALAREGQGETWIESAFRVSQR
jgi:hypothetical protein